MRCSHTPPLGNSNGSVPTGSCAHGPVQLLMVTLQPPFHRP
jgi:hypothetical protein